MSKSTFLIKPTKVLSGGVEYCKRNPIVVILVCIFIVYVILTNRKVFMKEKMVKSTVKDDPGSDEEIDLKNRIEKLTEKQEALLNSVLIENNH